LFDEAPTPGPLLAPAQHGLADVLTALAASDEANLLDL
jgi:hypothetical protein